VRGASRPARFPARIPIDPSPLRRKPSKTDDSGRLAAASVKSSTDRRESVSVLSTSSWRRLLGNRSRGGGRKQAYQLLFQRAEGYSCRRVARVEDDIPALRQCRAVQSKHFAQAALHPIPHDGSPHPGRHRDAQSRRWQAVGPEEHCAQGPAPPLTLVINSPEFRSLEEPRTFGECPPGWRDTHADRRWRPFWRRLFRTRRPPEVFMRLRKPCVLARRRRFG
jgi:hypothetical protein